MLSACLACAKPQIEKTEAWAGWSAVIGYVVIFPADTSTPSFAAFGLSFIENIAIVVTKQVGNEFSIDCRRNIFS